MSSIEERLAELHARFSDVYSAGENMSNEFYTAMDLATQLAGVLREVERTMICTEQLEDHTQCGDCRVIRRLRALLNGGDDEHK